MPHLSTEEKRFFKQNGYLVRHGVLTDDVISNARDALWTGITADRSDPTTWIGAAPREPVARTHPALEATVSGSAVFEIAEEIAGKDTLRPCGAEAALVYPTGTGDWAIPTEGHLDGYYMPCNGVPEGTVDRFMVAATIYLADVEHRGGGFIVWPGSHRAAMEYFKTNALLSIRGSSPKGAFDVKEPKEITGPAGTVCFWHGQLVHTGSTNAGRDIRMALIARFHRWDESRLLFETPDDEWRYYEPIRSLDGYILAS